MYKVEVVVKVTEKEFETEKEICAYKEGFEQGFVLSKKGGRADIKSFETREEAYAYRIGVKEGYELDFDNYSFNIV